MWTNAGESPISVYMRYLQNPISETGQSRPAAPLTSSGLLPTPPPATDPAALPVLASPTAQFGVPSPSDFLNLLSPRSPYPLLSPGFQFPPPLHPTLPSRHNRRGSWVRHPLLPLLLVCSSHLAPLGCTPS